MATHPHEDIRHTPDAGRHGHAPIARVDVFGLEEGEVVEAAAREAVVNVAVAQHVALPYEQKLCLKR